MVDPLSFAIATQGFDTSHQTRFDVLGDGADVWSHWAKHGRLQDVQALET